MTRVASTAAFGRIDATRTETMPVDTVLVDKTPHDNTPDPVASIRRGAAPAAPRFVMRMAARRGQGRAT